MEQFIQYFVENWESILEKALIFVSYFLVFLYRAKVNGTKDNLGTLFKENTTQLLEMDAKLREDMQAEHDIWSKALEDSVAKYESAVSIIKKLQDELMLTKNALAVFLEDIMEVKDGEIHDDQRD